jgi:hypothetical protein
MQMYRAVLVNNPELDNLCENFVCVLAHREDYPKAWNDASMQYMPQYFFTPAYVFLAPDGKPLNEDFTRLTMHSAVDAKRIIAELKSVSAKFPNPLDRNKWLELRKILDDLRSKDPAEAKKAFSEKEKMFAGTNLAKEVRMLKNRANAVVICREWRTYLDAETNNIALVEEYFTAKDEKTKSEIEEKIKANSTAWVVVSDWLGPHDNKIEAEESVKKDMVEMEKTDKFLEHKNDPLEVEHREVLGDAINSVIEGDYFAAQQRITLFLGAYPENEFPAENAILLDAIKPVIEKAAEVGRFRVQKLSFDNAGEYYEIGATVLTHLPKFGEITLQYYVLTDNNSVFAGYRTFENVQEGRHRHAAYLPIKFLGSMMGADGKPMFEGVSDVYVEIYSRGFLVASGEMNVAPAATWWKRENVKPLEMLDSFNRNWDSGTMKPSGEPGLIYGK